MSVYSYESFLMNKAEKSAKPMTSKFQKVGYFSLKNDGDTAVVRFAYKDKSEFEIATVHTVEIDGRYKRVVCLRDAKDPIEKCPLCDAGEKLYSKFYVKLIEYTKDEEGKVVATPKVWERPAGFAQVLDSLCTEYGGSLSEHVFKIKRRGAKGDMQTTYDVMYANPELYKESVGYVKDFSAFENFDLSKHSYYIKSFAELEEFLETGKFPDTVKTVTEEDDKDEGVPQSLVSHQVRPVAEVVTAGMSNSKVVTADMSNPYLNQNEFGFSSETFEETKPQQTDPTFSRPRRTPGSEIYK